MNDLREFGKFQLDAFEKTLWFENAPVDLPLKEIEVLCVLTGNGGAVVSKQELLDAVWQDSFVEESNVSRHIYLLRKMLKDHGEERELIQTVPRRGYRFTGEIRVRRDDLVIEHHVLGQTVFEEVDLRSPPNKSRKTNDLRLQNGVAWSFRRVAVLVCALALLTGLLSGFALWLYNRSAERANMAEMRSIAVLPLKSFSNSQTDEELRLRVTDALITRLASVELGFSVRPTRAVLPFVRTEKDAIEIGKSLEVDAVLDGRLQQEGERIRVTLQLISVKTGEQIWSQQFDGKATGILNLQDEISSQLLQKLNLSDGNNLAKRPTGNDEAYENYLTGRFFWNKRTPESLRSAITAFETAIKLDANFADAYVGLADSYYSLFDYSYDTSPNNVERAKENLNKAMQLNPNLPEAYTTLGLIQTTYEWNWKAAEASLRKAKELAPNSPNAHHRLGTLFIRLRRFDEAEDEIRKAKELDPTSTAINANLGLVFLNSKRSDEAIPQLQKTLELDPNFTVPRWYLSRCYRLRGEKNESVSQWAKAIESDGDKDLADSVLQNLNSFGEKTAIEKLAVEWEKRMGPQGVNDHDMAMLSAFLGDKQRTLSWLEKSVAAHHPWATWINAEPEFGFVRDEPRFIALMKKMNFE